MAIASASVVKTRARELGFTLCGITPARPAPHLAAYLRWIDQGLHGSLDYMARLDRVARRRDLNVVLPGARSLVLVALDYHQHLPASALNAPERGRIAQYAWGNDYHDLMLPRLEALAEGLRVDLGSTVHWRAYVDTGAVLERDHAQQAGLGFIGKNTLLIHPRRGSGFFLGEIVLDSDFDLYDRPGPETRCGSCTRCLSACPTGAFVEPYVLDARRCISALTIENKGVIDPALRPQMGNWVFGCDDCQTVCPWNRFAVATLEPTLALVDLDRAAPLLSDWLALTDVEVAHRFSGTPPARAGRERLVRNACIAAGNSRHAPLARAVEPLLADASPMVRGHAAWALVRLSESSGPALTRRLAVEPDAAVRQELVSALAESVGKSGVPVAPPFGGAQIP